VALILKNTTFHYDFFHKGKRYQGSTGESDRLEAALGYWITGHPAFGGNKKINGQIEPDESLDEPVEPSPVLPTYLQGLDSDEASRR